MKVPTYTSQVKRTTAGGSGFLSARMNPNTAASSGGTIATIGSEIFNLGIKKLDIEAKSQVNNAALSLEQELYEITEKNKNNYLQPLDAEKKVEEQIKATIKKYTSGKVTDGSGSSLLSNKKALSSFPLKAQELASKYIIDFKKENNKLVVELNKNALSADTDNAINNITNFQLTDFDRLQFFNNLFDENNGILSNAVRNGDINTTEFLERVDKSFENVVIGTMEKLMQNSDDAFGVAMAFSEGNIPDVVMQQALGQLDKTKKLSLTKSLITLANSIDKQKDDAIKENELRIEKDKLAIYNSIFNGDYDDPLHKAKVDANVKLLKGLNYFDPAKLNSLNNYFKMYAPPEEKEVPLKSKQTTLNMLYQADLDGELSIELVTNSLMDLIQKDRDYFMKRAITEFDGQISEAENAAKTIIASSMKYEKYKDGIDALSKAASAQYHSAIGDFTRWLTSNGKNASYEEIIDKAEKIILKNQEPLKLIIQNEFDRKVILMMSSGIMDGADFDPPDKNRYKSLLNFFKKPETIKKMKSNALLLSFYNNLMEFATEDVQ
jgi:very-short-patch-repair endonuclease